MGMTIGIQYHVVKDSERGEVVKCVSGKQYRKFPPSRKKARMSLLVEFMGFPMHEFRNNRLDPKDVYWWPDAQFVPNDDSVVFITAGVFEPRTHNAWISPPHIPNGRILKIELDKETLRGEVFPRTRMPNFPKLHMHPSGDYIGYIGLESVKIETILHEERFNKHKDLRACNYRYCEFSPNGKYLAIILSASRQLELIISMVDKALTSYDRGIVLTKIVPGLKIRTYNEHVECKWSPDSEHIAVCSSIGILFVLDKNLQLVVKVDEEILPEETFPSWSSTFDYDPRSFHECLAVGTNTRCLYFVNSVSKEIFQKSDTICSSSIDCVQFEPNGSFVCVATRNFVLHFIDSSSASALYRIDMMNESPNLEQKFASIPNVIRLSFSNTGEQLATSTCDGKVRLYQLTQDISLFNLCKWEILSVVPQSEVKNLPIPKLIISKLLSLPTMK